MRLLVDIGNTRIKWALDDGAGLRVTGSLVHRDISPADAMRFLAGIEGPLDVIGAVNVAGASLADALVAACRQRFGVEPQFLQTSERCGDVVNGYIKAGQLGTDRWAAIVSAWQEFRSDVCVIDAGTAVTVDLVAADGRHCGGFILPGIDLMTRALNSDTSDIEGFAAAGSEDLPASDWLGRDTRSAVARGACFALRAAVTAAADAHAASVDRPVTLVLTGGDASRLLPFPGRQVEERPELVLSGVGALLAEHTDA